MAPDIGARLQDLREATGWTQAELARKVGRFKADTWRDWEQGKRAPNPALLEDLAERENWPIEIFAKGGRMPSAVVNLGVNEISQSDLQSPPYQLSTLRQVAEILADAFAEIAVLLSLEEQPKHPSPPLEALARKVEAGKAGERIEEPTRKRKDAG